VAGGEAPRQECGLDHYSTRELRRAAPSFDKRDGHLGDAATGGGRFPREFDQKRIAVRGDRMQRKLLEEFAAPAPKATRAIGNPQAGDRANIAVRERAQQFAMFRLVLNAPTWYIARANEEVRVCGGVQQPGNVDRIVRQVRIHLTDHRCVCAQRALHAVDT
jgi:hypothetical protein